MSFRICNGHRGWFCQDGIRSQRRLATQLKGEHSSSEKETLHCRNMGQVPLVAFSTFFSVKGAQDKPFPSVLGPPQSPSVGGSRIPWYHWSLTSLGFVSLLSLTVVKITSRWSFLDHWTVEHLSPVEMSTNFIKKIGPTTWSPGRYVLKSWSFTCGRRRGRGHWVPGMCRAVPMICSQLPALRSSKNREDLKGES